MNRMQEKPKRKKKGTTHPIFNWRVLSGLAAVFVMMLAGSLFFLGSGSTNVYVDIPQDATCQGVYQNPTVQRRLQGDEAIVTDSRTAVQPIIEPEWDDDGSTITEPMATPIPMELTIPEEAKAGSESEVSVPAMVTTSVYSGTYDVDGADGDVAFGTITDDTTTDGYASEPEVGIELGRVGGDYNPGVVEERTQSLDPLQAGEIDDNAEWDAYMTYRNNYLLENSASTVADRDVSDRQIIRVQDSQGNPVQGACVQIYNGELLVHESLTYATGLTMFFPNLSDATRYVDTRQRRAARRWPPAGRARKRSRC